jgi:NitT/TauT family transport system substrate-binding protein
LRKLINLRRMTTIAATMAVIVLPACSSGGSASSPNGPDVGPVKLTVTSVPGSILSLPEYVAHDKGFYKAHGLDVTLLPITSGPASTQALLTGAAQISFNNPDAVLQANDKGQSLKIVGGEIKSAITTILARKAWPLPHAGSYPAVMADLKGAKIGVTVRGSSQEIWLRRMLTDGGLNPDKDVTFVAVGIVATALPALQSGQIDVWSGFEPGTTIALSQLKIANVVVDMRKGDGPKELVNYSSEAFVATDKYIKENGDALKRFMAAIADTEAWMVDASNRTELEGLVAKNVKIDAALIPQLLDDNLGTFGVAVPRENIENAITINKQAHMITGSPTYDSVVATEFVPSG